MRLASSISDELGAGAGAAGAHGMAAVAAATKVAAATPAPAGTTATPAPAAAAATPAPAAAAATLAPAADAATPAVAATLAPAAAVMPAPSVAATSLPPPPPLAAQPTAPASPAAASCCISSPTAGTECVPAGLALAFRDNALCERGTTLSLFDYADAWERLACGVAYVSAQDDSCPQGASTLSRFEARFPGRVALTRDAAWPRVADFVAATGVVGLYQQMAGASWATNVWPPCAARMMVHAVFDAKDPHGDAYAAISPTLARPPGTDAVQYIVAQPPPGVDPAGLRAALGIPPKGGAADDTVVWCRHGGYGSMSLQWARDALCELLRRERARATRPWFVLLNTAPLECAGDVSAYGRVRYRPATTSREEVFTFLATCDACVHARLDGESFGLAVAECSRAGLPVLTSGVRVADGDHHLNALGSLALLYHDGEGLIRAITSATPAVRDGWRAAAGAYRALYNSSQPEAAMVQFIRVFQPHSPQRARRPGCEAGVPAAA